MDINTPITEPQTEGRAQKLVWEIIETLLSEMLRGLQNPLLVSEDAKEKNFGSKQNMVVNLHRLVVTMAAIRAFATKAANNDQSIPSGLTQEEMLMLRDLLGASESSAMEAVQERLIGRSAFSFPDSEPI